MVETGANGLAFVLRVAGDVLSRPSTSSASFLLKFPVRFVYSLCRGLRSTLAMQCGSCSGWPRCGLWDLSGLAELSDGGVLGHDAEDEEWV
jgi:hypothetical protein